MWATAELESGTDHILPIDDLRPHELRPLCWCRPVRDNTDPGRFFHNAMDNREQYESGELLPH